VKTLAIRLAYGMRGLVVDLPDDRTTVIEPAHAAGLPDERAAVLAALRQPVGAPPLRETVKPGDRVCVVFTDSTRATPNERLIPWLLEELAHVPPANLTLLNSTGTHRANTPDELARMLSPEVMERYRVLNHDCHDDAALVAVGAMRDGTPALLNRHLVEADARIITGFIEPHFFAGFSGGPKGVIPGCAGLRSVMANHRPANIGHPNATFGVTEGNPLWEELREVALRVGPGFLLNVALNTRHQITGVFAGDLIAAHQAGCEFVRAAAMQKVAAPFDIVVTTNSGAPLDLNLYQGVKGMSAAARIVKPGGAIVLACECREGVPAGSAFERLLRDAAGPAALLARLAAADEVQPEQWQAQIQAQIQGHARVLLRSSLPDEVVRACHLEPCPDIGGWVRRRLAELGPAARVAVLPQGPLTIPYLAAA
jgi:nickel-dependent lactate racemase